MRHLIIYRYLGLRSRFSIRYRGIETYDFMMSIMSYFIYKKSKCTLSLIFVCVAMSQGDEFIRFILDVYSNGAFSTYVLKTNADCYLST